MYRDEEIEQATMKRREARLLQSYNVARDRSMGFVMFRLREIVGPSLRRLMERNQQ